MADAAGQVQAQLKETTSRLAEIRADYAGLLAACRASVAAAAAGHPDPLGYVRGLLAERRQLPPAGAFPLVVLADARTAFHLTGYGSGTGESPRPYRPDTDTPLTAASGPPGPGAASPPIAAPCGCVFDFKPGPSGDRGPFTLTVSCGQHGGPPAAAGRYWVSWPDHPLEPDAACPGCVGRGTGSRCWMCGGQIPGTLRRRPGDPSEIQAGCADCRAGRVHAHETVTAS